MAITSLSHHPFTKISSLSHKRPSFANHPPSFIKFRTAHYENLRYLKSLGIIDSQSKSHRNSQSPDAVNQILTTVDFLKSKGFSDQDFSRLSFLCPQLFSPDFDLTDISPVFDFLTTDLTGNVQEIHGLILRCPQILLSDVEFCLRPTLDYLKQIGIVKLNSPTNLNAHLLNIRVEKLRSKTRYLEGIGFSKEEAGRVCVRMPAILGYSVEGNMEPKYEYLVKEMERDLEELKRFPQYFAFSLEKRIMPRHLHLKIRNVHIPLNRMLLWSDNRFYTKWK